jgi:hypothetical protein
MCTVARLLSRGVAIKNRLHEQITDALKHNARLHKQTKKIITYFNPVITDIDEQLDLFAFHNQYRGSVDIEAVLSSIKECSSRHIADAIAYYTALIDELSDQEAYDHLTTRRRNNYIKQLRSIIDALTGIPVPVKVRKPRKPRAKTIRRKTTNRKNHNDVKHLKYLQKCNVLDITSINPTKIIGAPVLWVYDTRKRLLVKYVADSTTGLHINRTTITGVDKKKSSSRNIRVNRVREIIGSIISEPPGRATKMFEKIRCKPKIPSGRLNEHILLLKVCAK